MLQTDNGIAGNRTLLPVPGPLPGETLDGVRIVYDGGELCDAPGAPRVPRITVLDMLCTPDVDPPVLKYIAEDPPCTYSFALESKDACKVGSRARATNRTSLLARGFRPPR